MTSSYSSSSVRSIPSIRLEVTSLENPEASTSETSSRIPSPIGAKALRDLEVTKNVDMMNLVRLCAMPKVPTGKLGLAARATMSSPEVQEVPTEAALSVDAPTPKRLAEGSIPPLVGSSHAHKRVKVTVGKHKSRRGDGSSRAYCCIGWGDRATRVSLPQVNEGAVRDNGA
ncbi:hypothetical protein GW17_00030839 [Ensete ventricosum]|nr:hypothetical protein GW17_00030839 [Ensete ventricosum]